MADDGLDLDAIAARANAATPGPWEYAAEFHPSETDEHVVPDYWSWQLDSGGGDVLTGLDDPTADLAFIAHARADVPALGNEVAALRYAAAHLYERLCDISDEWPGTIAECIPDAPDSARAAALDAWLWYSDRETRP